MKVKDQIISKILLQIMVLFLFNISLNAQEKVEESKIINEWKGKKPALILKEDKSKVFTGTIVKVEKNGVIFDPKRESIFYDPPQKFYPFNEVETLIGNNGEFIYSKGKLRNEVFASEELVKTDPEENDIKHKYVFPYRIRLNADYGYSSRRVKISDDVPAEFKDYMNDLKSGTNFNADVSYFFSNRYGIGFKYSRFSTSTFVDGISVFDPATGEVLGIGLVEDNISISFVGPTFFERGTIVPDKLLYVSNLTIGQVSYFNDAKFLTFPIKIEGKNIGIGGTIGLDFFITKDFAIGVNFSYLYGKITNIKVNGESIDMEEDESMNRWDFNIGLKLYR